MLCFFLPLALFASPGAVQAVSPDQAVVDETPSEPAAIGFLKGFVDKRLYTLEGQGAAEVQGDAVIHFTGPGVRPPEVRAHLHHQFAVQGSSIELESPQDNQEAAAVLEFASPYLEALFSSLPSAVDSRYRARLKMEGEIVRLDFSPRSPDEGYREWQAWYQEDGTPLRQRFVVQRGTETGVVDVTYEHEEVDGMVLPVLQKSEVPGGNLTISMEYARTSGYRVLRRLVLTAVDREMEIVFEPTVRPERGPR